MKSIKKRLKELRTELREERISYGEITELQSLAEHIEPGDVELLQAAGVPEFVDLFEQIETLPQNVQDVITKYDDSDSTYKTCEALKSDLNAIGYDCDCGLDASPYNLTPKNSNLT